MSPVNIQMTMECNIARNVVSHLRAMENGFEVSEIS